MARYVLLHMDKIPVLHDQRIQQLVRVRCPTSLVRTSHKAFAKCKVYEVFDENGAKGHVPEEGIKNECIY